MRVIIGALVAIVVLGTAVSAHAETYQGFGASTKGGAGRPIVRVTTLADSGPGSLRTALAKGQRTIVFDVAGDIVLLRPLLVGGPVVTIDGSTAPPPGITLLGQPLVISGSGVHDVIVRDLRVRDSVDDCIRVGQRAYKVVLDHVSTSRCGDGSIDITEEAHDVTVSWSILAEPVSKKQMLIKYKPSRITLHHNVFTLGQQRNPQISREGDKPATDTTVDMRNNVVWDWGFGYGTFVMFGPRANVVDNYYENPGGSDIDKRQGLLVCRGDGVERPESSPACPAGGAASAARVYAHGNVSGNGDDIDGWGHEPRPFPAPAVTTADACSAARLVLAGAGARPTDGIDQAYLSAITLTGCGG